MNWSPRSNSIVFFSVIGITAEKLIIIILAQWAHSAGLLHCSRSTLCHLHKAHSDYFSSNLKAILLVLGFCKDSIWFQLILICCYVKPSQRKSPYQVFFLNPEPTERNPKFACSDTHKGRMMRFLSNPPRILLTSRYI